MINVIKSYQVAVNIDDATDGYEERLSKINTAGCSYCIMNNVILFGFIPHEQQAISIHEAITGKDGDIKCQK